MNSTQGDRNRIQVSPTPFRARRRTLLPLEREPLPLPAQRRHILTLLNHTCNAFSVARAGIWGNGAKWRERREGRCRGRRGEARGGVPAELLWHGVHSDSFGYFVCLSFTSTERRAFTTPPQQQSRLTHAVMHQPSKTPWPSQLLRTHNCGVLWGGGVAVECVRVHNSHEITAARCSCKIKMVDVMTAVVVNSRWRIIKRLFWNCRLVVALLYLQSYFFFFIPTYFFAIQLSCTAGQAISGAPGCGGKSPIFIFFFSFFFPPHTTLGDSQSEHFKAHTGMKLPRMKCLCRMGTAVLENIQLLDIKVGGSSWPWTPSVRLGTLLEITLTKEPVK